MESSTVEMVHTKETKGAHLYEADQSTNPVTTSVYLRKSAVGTPAPKAIKVTVEAL